MFAVNLAVIRFEEAHQHVPFMFFTHGPDGMQLHMISDSFFADEQGNRVLVEVELPRKVASARARFCSLVAQLTVEDTDFAVVGSFGRGDFLCAKAPLLERRGRPPSLARWTDGEDFVVYMRGQLEPASHSLLP